MAQPDGLGGEQLMDLPLPALFERGRSQVQALEAAPPSEPATRRLAAAAAACLAAAAAAADGAALFSANEERDDLATGDIKYLLIPFYRAEAATHLPGADPAERLASLSEAAQHYRVYLHRCRQYGLLSPPALALADAALGGAEEGEEDGSSGSSGGGRLDPAALRQHKIEKFKRERAIRARLEDLEQRRGFGGFGGSSKGDAAAAAAAAEDGGGGSAGGDEEAEREAWLLQADLAGLQAAERLGSLRQELAILRHAAAMPAEQRQRERVAREQRGPLPDLLRQLAAAAGNLSSNASAQRERMGGEVFRPSHVLPTMSVEQFGELEYQRMVEQQAREAAAKERHERRQAERSADDVEEEELQKARAWDAFKDDNPRGWGNSKLRPCA